MGGVRVRRVLAVTVAAVVLLAAVLLVAIHVFGGADGDAPADAAVERKASSMRAYVDSNIEDLEADAQIDRYDPSGQAKETQLRILRQASETGEMSASDYRASWDRYKQCMTDRGYKEIILVDYPNGVIAEAPHRGGDAGQEGAYHQDMLECGTMHTLYVDYVYKTMVGNPDLYEDMYEGALACLRREDVAPKDYDMDDFMFDMREASPDEFVVNIYQPDAAACLVANGITIAPEGTPIEELW